MIDKIDLKDKIENFSEKTKAKWNSFVDILKNGNVKVACSMLVMGVGQLLYKQWAKGILYILLQAAFIVYLVMAGAADFFGLFTLGSVAANPW